jgi:transcriptional regulator with XRE-family HTH domain
MLTNMLITGDRSERSERLPSPRLRGLLRNFRIRIDPGLECLGPHRRTPARQGKRVSQEEVAEFIGVSRTWYGLLESERPARVSSLLLDRLATILMLSADERATLFALALPELDFGGRKTFEFVERYTNHDIRSGARRS